MNIDNLDLATLRAVAAQGDDNAAHAVGHCYASTMTPEGLEEAARWLDRAAKHGHAKAAICLAGVRLMQAGVAGLQGAEVNAQAAINDAATLLALARLFGSDLSECPPDTWRYITPDILDRQADAARIWLDRASH